MAHSLQRQAQVWVMLWFGDTPRYIEKVTGVPRTTIRRWRPVAMAYLRECLQQTDRPIKMALKKGQKSA